MIDQLRLGFNHPVFAQADRETTFHRQRHCATFGRLPGALAVAAVTVHPAATGAQVHVPAFGAGQAPVGAQALALQVEGFGVGIGKGATGQQAIGSALELTRAADQSDPLGMTTAILQGEDGRAFDGVGVRNGIALGQIIGLCLPRCLPVKLIPGQRRGVFNSEV
ncbi:hypothetical protein D3C84_762310 [compost metagenome]